MNTFARGIAYYNILGPLNYTGSEIRLLSYCKKQKPIRTHVCIPITGDVMGPTLNNLDKLLRLPFGCGEQNMIHFAPNVFVLKYLQKTGQLSPEVETEATDYLIQGKEQGARLQLLDCIFIAKQQF